MLDQIIKTVCNFGLWSLASLSIMEIYTDTYSLPDQSNQMSAPDPVKICLTLGVGD